MFIQFNIKASACELVYINLLCAIDCDFEPTNNFNCRYNISFNKSHMFSCQFKNYNFKRKSSLANSNYFYYSKLKNCTFEDAIINSNINS